MGRSDVLLFPPMPGPNVRGVTVFEVVGGVSASRSELN